MILIDTTAYYSGKEGGREGESDKMIFLFNCTVTCEYPVFDYYNCIIIVYNTIAAAID